MTHFCLFPTALGDCGIAWRGDLVVATYLPETTPEKTAARLAARADATRGEPPPVIEQAIGSISALLDGEGTDLSFIACDFSSANSLTAQIYNTTRAIPAGETRTYGEIAEQVGDKLLAQKVGQAMGQNPLPIIVPCHRVMGANGKLTGFSAQGGVETKLKMLAIERASIGEPPGLFEELPLAMKPQR